MTPAAQSRFLAKRDAIAASKKRPHFPRQPFTQEQIEALQWYFHNEISKYNRCAARCERALQQRGGCG